MSSAPDYRVTFKRTKGDRALLTAVEQLLVDRPDLTFSDLCKQALQRWLVATETSAAVLMLTELQQQVTVLNEQLTTIEQQVLQDETGAIARLDAQVAALTERLAQLEEAPPAIVHEAVTVTTDQSPDQSSNESDESEPKPDDPLLNRLGGLLEEF
jgi:hypothetical protein